MYLPMSDLISAEKEIARVKKQIDSLTKDLLSLNARLNSNGFREKAKPEVVDAVLASVREKQAMLEALQLSLEKHLSNL